MKQQRTGEFEHDGAVSEEQRERLSAYLDRELAPDEHTAIERHLAGCRACQQALSELRNVRSLLAALPQPVPPRSLLLPLTENENSGDLGTPDQLKVPVAHISVRRPAPRLAVAAQWCGSLAAALGLLLLGGTLLLGGHSGHMTATASRAAAGAVSPTQTPEPPTPSGGAGPFNRNVPTVKSPTATVPADATPQPTPSAPPTQQAEPEITTGEPAVVPITGAALAGGGAVLLVAGTAVRRSRPRE